ncbi:Ring canal kelch protein [Sergentomyia squamirostris]
MSNNQQNNGNINQQNNNNNNNNNNQGSLDRGSCILFRYASQNSLDESSQKQIPRQNAKDKASGSYKNQQHTMRSFEKMNEMRRQNLLCDIILVAEDMEIPAHRMVLASCSPYFYAMFTGFEESRQERITLQGVDYHALQLLIDYVYTSVVEVTEENVQVLLTAANLLQLNDVRDACCDYLQSQLDPSNCLGIRDFADMHGCIDLLNHADTYVEQHFAEVVQFDEFLNLTHEQVVNLISSDRISVPSEEKVFECVIAWINYDITVRQQYLSALMEYVRLPLLSQEYLVQRVEKEPLLKGDIQCKDYLIEALKYHLLKGEIKASFKTPRTVPRQPVGLPKVLLVIGGQAPKAIRSVECYDLREEKWYQAAEMPTRRCRAGLAVLGDRVYAVGGFNGSLRVRTVDVYDPSTDSWSTCTSMEARRSTLGVAVLNGLIYAVGGFDGSTGLSSAEYYDPRKQEWQMIASMSIRRSSVGVGVVNSLLYAVGGYDGASRQCLASVERYNPSNDEWSQVAEMKARRSGAGVGVLDNILYAVGGHDGPQVRKSVEAYNPERNVWYPVADMSFCRRNAGVVAHDGLLYVVGGDDGTSNLFSVEVYCPDTDTWRILPSSMGIGRSYAARYANCGGGGADEENSQAEGSGNEGAVGYGQQNVQPNNQNGSSNSSNPHYENIYESIDQYAAAPAAPAAQQQHVNNGEAAEPRPFRIQPQRSNGFRNELYDRTAGYDVPRQVRGNFSSNLAGSVRRANLHLDLNPNRPRYTSASRPHRQRSFDDTESYHYNNYLRYENIYEQIREDPIYRQSSSASGSRMYGRLDVIGHGIGRIERHLSSSCGNIDHYNLGGHYAVLGHSHLGTVGHIRLNAGSGTKCCDSKDNGNGVKSSYSFFSCLGGENSQSMHNIHRAANPGPTVSAGGVGAAAGSRDQVPTVRGTFPATRATGTIPKLTKTKNKTTSSNHTSSTLNRISKSSLQWLLMNKWLPLWIGQGPDCKIIDFNFMFSRNCEGCGDTENQQQGLVRFNGQAEMRPRLEVDSQRRLMCNNHSLARLRECEYGNSGRRDNWWSESPPRLGTYDVPRLHRQQPPFMRTRSESPNFNQSANIDPFRNWELNTENNSFRPANGRVREVKRITDGTFRVKDVKEPAVQAERSASPIPSTSRGITRSLALSSSDDERMTSPPAQVIPKVKQQDDNPSSSSSESMKTAERDTMEGSSDESVGATTSFMQNSASEVNSENAEEDQIDDDDFPESDEITPTESK